MFTLQDTRRTDSLINLSESSVNSWMKNIFGNFSDVQIVSDANIKRQYYFK